MIPNIERGRDLIYQAYKSKPEEVKEAFLNRLRGITIGFRNFLVGQNEYNLTTHTFYMVDSSISNEKFNSAERAYDVVLPDCEKAKMNEIAKQIAVNILPEGKKEDAQDIAAFLEHKLEIQKSAAIDFPECSNYPCNTKILKFCRKLFDGKMLSNDEKAKKLAEKAIKQAEIKKKAEAHAAYLSSPQYAYDQLLEKRQRVLEKYEELRALARMKISEEDAQYYIQEAAKLEPLASTWGNRIVTQLKLFFKTELGERKKREFSANPLPAYELDRSGPKRLDYAPKDEKLAKFIYNLGHIYEHEKLASQALKALSAEDKEILALNPKEVLTAPVPLDQPKAAAVKATAIDKTTDKTTETAKQTEKSAKTDAASSQSSEKPKVTKAGEKPKPKAEEQSFFSWLCSIPSMIWSFFKSLFGF